MTTKSDATRAIRAAKIVIDNRDPVTDMASIMVTLEHTVATVLLAVMDRNGLRAAAMLNEGLVQGVENRLALFSARRKT